MRPRQHSDTANEEAFYTITDYLQRSLASKYRYKYVPNRTAIQNLLYEISGSIDQYLDELIKLKGKRGPLTTSILVSAIMEGVLQMKLLENIEKASNTRTWRAAVEREEKYNSKRDHPFKTIGAPQFDLNDLISLTAEMKWVNTHSLHEKIDEAIVRYIWKDREEVILKTLKVINKDTADFSRNLTSMHELRGLRNQVHPLKLIKMESVAKPYAYNDAMWLGIRFMVIANVLLNLEAFQLVIVDGVLKASRVVKV